MSDEVGKIPACSRCQKICCGIPNVMIPLTDEESKKLPKDFQEELFVEEPSSRPYATEPKVPTGIMTMRSDKNGCCALDSNGKCSIYNDRPIYCRLFSGKLVYSTEKKKFSLMLDDCPTTAEIGGGFNIDSFHSPRSLVGNDYIELTRRLESVGYCHLERNRLSNQNRID
jgi:Fe-S-cluster containining protein